MGGAHERHEMPTQKEDSIKKIRQECEAFADGHFLLRIIIPKDKSRTNNINTKEDRHEKYVKNVKHSQTGIFRALFFTQREIKNTKTQIKREKKQKNPFLLSFSKVYGIKEVI